MDAANLHAKDGNVVHAEKLGVSGGQHLLFFAAPNVWGKRVPTSPSNMRSCPSIEWTSPGARIVYLDFVPPWLTPSGVYVNGLDFDATCRQQTTRGIHLQEAHGTFSEVDCLCEPPSTPTELTPFLCLMSNLHVQYFGPPSLFPQYFLRTTAYFT